MTVFLPDISGYETGISLAGMPAVIVKATEGTSYLNPDYGRVVHDAAGRGIPLVAYHFLRQGNAAAQADYAFSHIGANVPTMIDVEAEGTSTPNVTDTITFCDEFRKRGGNCRLVYLPHWYWQNNLGSPSLVPLVQRGLLLIASNYTTYSDTGPGWAPYGGMTPTLWQYTDAHQLNGFTVDMNAYRGTVDQFASLIKGGPPQMELTDQVPGTATTDHPGNRNVGEILGDLAQLRAMLYGQKAMTTYPSAAPLNQMYSAVTAPTKAALTDAQMTALTAQITAAVTAAHPSLSTADEPIIEEAVRVVLHNA